MDNCLWRIHYLGKRPTNIGFWTKFSPLSDGYLRFSKLKFFDPQNLKNQKFLKTFDKINNFQNFQKTEKTVLDIHLTSSHAKFQLNISIRGLDIAKKPYSLMTSFFQNAILSISRRRTEIKMTFLES